MRFTSHVLPHVSCILISLVFAKPANLPVPNIEDTSTHSSNGSLLDSSNPRGPLGFDINALHGYKPLRRVACYMSAVHLLAIESTRNFEGLLPMEKASYNDRLYQDLTIEVSSTRLYQLMPRKYLLWGIARIMHKMTVDNSFVDSWYELTWEGSLVGEILFVAVPLRAQSGIQRNDTLPVYRKMDQSSGSAVSTATNALSFEYTLIQEQLLTGEDVFMGTIGALVQLAQAPHQLYNQFAGNFPGEPGVFPTYNAQIYWTNVYLQETLPLTKGLLAESMVAAVEYGLSIRDFHALGVLVKDNGRQVARGGYLLTRLPTAREWKEFLSSR